MKKYFKEFLNKASVQGAIVAGLFLLIGIAVPNILQIPKLQEKISGLEKDNSEKVQKILTLETQLVPFKTIALEKFVGSEDERLQQLSVEIKRLVSEQEEQKWKKAAQFNRICGQGYVTLTNQVTNLMIGSEKSDEQNVSRIQCHEFYYKNWQEVIQIEPMCPFPYYYLSVCYKRTNNQNWNQYLNQAKNILNKTINIKGVNSEQEVILSRINEIFK